MEHNSVMGMKGLPVKRSLITQVDWLYAMNLAKDQRLSEIDVRILKKLRWTAGKHYQNV